MSYKETLLLKMADIDAEKRSIKSRLSRISSEPDGEFGRGRERQTQIRKMRDKLSFLTEEREIVRAKLGRIKLDQKALNESLNSKNDRFLAAFYAAALRTLTEEELAALELRAVEMIED